MFNVLNLLRTSYLVKTNHINKFSFLLLGSLPIDSLKLGETFQSRFKRGHSTETRVGIKKENKNLSKITQQLLVFIIIF